jgi:hypothetical protein
LNLQTLATLAIAVFAAVIAFAQWYTAHQRAVLELFERRMTAYSAIREAIAAVMTKGTVTDENFIAYMRAIDQADYLFGEDVKNYLNDLRMELLRHQTAETNIKTREGAERERAVTARYQASQAINDFYKRFPPLLSPYARMDQKLQDDGCGGELVRPIGVVGSGSLHIGPATPPVLVHQARDELSRTATQICHCGAVFDCALQQA